MMKKTLAAVAVLGAFATSAFAAEVTVYGRIDAGFALGNYEATNLEGQQVQDETDFSMDSGLMSTNRLGFKGSETINEDLEIGFVLETKLIGDTGSAFSNGFDRESLVNLWCMLRPIMVLSTLVASVRCGLMVVPRTSGVAIM